jgi:hypothetical protein
VVVAEQEEEKEKRFEELGTWELGTLGICCNARRDKIK